MKKTFKKLASLLLSGTMLFSALELLPWSAREVSAYSTSIFSETEWEVLALVNKERSKAGLDPLTMYQNIQNAAHVRAKELPILFDHTRPDGRICFSALDEYKCDYWMAAENIAAGQASPSSVMTSWMNSPGHRANILTNGLSHIGIGQYKKNYNYWVQMFTGSCSPSSMEIVDMEQDDLLLVNKGTAIDNLDLAAKLTCRHGDSYLPVDASYCSGYNPNDTHGTIQTVHVSCLGVSADIHIQVAPSMSVPTKVQAVPSGNKKIQLSWKGSKDISSYCIEYSTKSSGPFKRIYLEDVDNCSYLVPGLSPGTGYYLRVAPMFKAADKYLVGNFSSLVKTNTRPAATAITSVSNKTRGQLTLTWNKTKGASGYRIFYSPTKNGTYKAVALLSGNTKCTYTHKGLKRGQKGFYKVCTFVRLNNKNYYGPYSPIRYGTVK